MKHIIDISRLLESGDEDYGEGTEFFESLKDYLKDWVGPNDERIVDISGEVQETWTNVSIRLSNGLSVNVDAGYSRDLTVEGFSYRNGSNEVTVDQLIIDSIVDEIYQIEEERDDGETVQFIDSALFAACVMSSNRVPVDYLIHPEGISGPELVIIVQLFGAETLVGDESDPSPNAISTGIALSWMRLFF
jgi:hypothetical protein